MSYRWDKLREYIEQRANELGESTTIVDPWH